MASEKLRQREVHKYYQSWLEASVGNDAATNAHHAQLHADGPPRRTSKDRALTAFAQLGCLRLNVKRAVVTLISTNHLYIIAEATRTLSLISDARVDEAEDEIWFGNAALPRRQSVSEDALGASDYIATDVNGVSFAAPALVVDDLTKHPRYASRGYAGNGVTFYCGVPIVTPSGIIIGVYNLTDDKPRNGLKAHELRFMTEMATVIMGHLETTKNEAARHRGEAMVFGIGRFVEGASTLYNRGPGSSLEHLQSPLLGAIDAELPETRDFKGLTVLAADPLKLHRIMASVQSINSLDRRTGPFSGSAKAPPPGNAYASAGQRPDEADTQLPGRTSDHAFSRAANILRECAAADGVLFYDAVSTNFAKRSSISGFRSPALSDEEDTKGEVAAERMSLDSQRDDASLDPDGSDTEDHSSSEVNSRTCRLLGYSVNVLPEWKSDEDALKGRQITEPSLRRLIKKYPRGKLFSFCDDGSISSSEVDQGPDDEPFVREVPDRNDPVERRRGKRTARAIARELKRLAPYAQNMIWLPIWDFSKQRWSAGAFLWSRSPERLATAQDDLVYLRTFANSIMVEVARLDAALADTAKSTFIANVSHELRSPLHGIVGNIDLLSDTSLDQFQQSLLGAIEVCGKMLTDTVDHVLDYSKINQLSKGGRRRKKSSVSHLPQLGQSGDISGRESSIEANFDLAIVVEEIVDSVHGSHVLRSKGFSRLGSQGRLDATSLKKEVSIILDIEYQDNWWVRSQPGAIRRVLTNLFENALKYTDAGSIQISLSTPASVKLLGPSPSTISLVLIVRDTGRGMSQDFVRNHAFTPFTQESQFSTGAGLGLSIIQQIVNSLGGTIKLESELGMGTEMKILLTLPRAMNDATVSKNSSVVDSVLPRTSGMALRILSPDGVDITTVDESVKSYHSSLAATARSWFSMQLAPVHSQIQGATELVLYPILPSAEHLIQYFSSMVPHHRVPVIAVAANTVEKVEFLKKYASITAQLGPCLEIVSHPVGPQKFGNAILRCLDRFRITGEVERVRADDFAGMRSLSSPAVPLTPRTADSPGPHSKTKGLAGLYATSTDARRFSTHFVPEHIAPLVNDVTPLARAESRRAKAFSSVPVNELSSPTKSESGDVLMTSPAGLPRFMPLPQPEKGHESARQAESPNRPFHVRVLLVDDNDINLNILIACMKRAKLFFETAKDGLQAVESFQQAGDSSTPFTHVLMDVTMPVMDGIEATRQIRQFERQRKRLKRSASDMDVTALAPSDEGDEKRTTNVTEKKNQQALVIALSGVASETIQHEMFEAGADMFLSKPAKLKELVKIILA